MMMFTVGIREVHVSYREVDLPRDSTREEIIDAALGVDDDVLEYSHTLDSKFFTIEPSVEYYSK